MTTTRRDDERKHAGENKRRPSCLSLVNDLDRSLAEITKTCDFALLVVLHIGVLECGEGVAGVGGRGNLIIATTQHHSTSSKHEATTSIVASIQNMSIAPAVAALPYGG
jgi:hypothetical protein